MGENSIKGIMETTIEKLRSMVNSQTIIGDPIVSNDITIIPVSKVSFGLATGGSDFPSKSSNKMFGGGGGAGVSITPVAFLVVKGENVKLVQIDNDSNTIDKAIELVPEMFDKVKDLFKKNERDSQDEVDVEL
ncbi:MAG: GerW family sporulation protein [bacterium]|nr:GerW family sporulation protein [bacterium]